ncbi:hypothetical protein IV203_027769 [Nitzschia inconspicua]|uniref:Uncharacterized protein n=1 Tax=Nitzschia inconspicua TaxID=303405 RepID=A0A9K3LXW4_9STRA|nr:hypothetical protein IV203_027769 [Nitzschia inconspicua]
MPRRHYKKTKSSRAQLPSFGGGSNNGDYVGKGSLQIIHNQTIEHVLKDERQRRAAALGQQQQQQQNDRRRRPFSLRTQLLHSLLRERQSYEAYQRTERRRRQGSLPMNDSAITQQPSSQQQDSIRKHPPGFLIRYDRSQDDQDMDDNDDIIVIDDQVKASKNNHHRVPPTLHALSLQVLSHYLIDYVNAMGREALQSALSLLPPESLTELSIFVSSSYGMTDQLAVVLGRQGHIDRLCLRAKPQSEEQDTSDDDDDDDDNVANVSSGHPLSTLTLTDRGLLALIMMTPSCCSHKAKHDNNDDDDDEYANVLEDWEDGIADDIDKDNVITNIWDHPQTNDNTTGTILPSSVGINIKLRRLELLDCQHLSAPVVLQLMGRCAGITHLSLAGSFVRNPQDGLDLLTELPHVLPNLQVLDVTRCPWLTTSLLSNLVGDYHRLWMEGPRTYPTSPKVFSQYGNVTTYL